MVRVRLPISPSSPCPYSALSMDPPVYHLPGFLKPEECQQLIQCGEGCWKVSDVVGDGNGVNSQKRTSQSCYLDNNDLPSLAKRITSIFPSLHPSQLECPQVGFYPPSGRYDLHFDAFDVSNPDGLRFCENGGQRIGTVLIYLNDVKEGGMTSFPKCQNMDGTMGIKVAPRTGDAVVFFPSYRDEDGQGNQISNAGWTLDPQALHAAEPVGAGCEKYVSQIWIREGCYRGVASRRLESPLIWEK